MGDRATKSGFSCFMGGFGTDKMSSVEEGRTNLLDNLSKVHTKATLKTTKVLALHQRLFVSP